MIASATTYFPPSANVYSPHKIITIIMKYHKNINFPKFHKNIFSALFL